MQIGVEIDRQGSAGDIGNAAIDFVRKASSEQLRRHVLLATVVSLVSLIGAFSSWAFIAFGPLLEPPAAQFSVFVLFCFASLALMALLSAVIPLGSVLARQGLQTLDATLRLHEMEEVLAYTEARLALASEFLNMALREDSKQNVTMMSGDDSNVDLRIARALLQMRDVAAARSESTAKWVTVGKIYEPIKDRLDKEDAELSLKIRRALAQHGNNG